MKLIIDRKVWLRGEKHGMLLRTVDGKRCCIGICLQAYGVPDEPMSDVGCVDDLPGLGSLPAPSWMKRDTLDVDDETDETVEVTRESAVLEGFYEVNDDEKLTDEQREVQLESMFADYGIEVEFV